MSQNEKKTVEVKCPFSIKDQTVDDSCDFLMKDEVGKICLKKSHKYYTQVVSQIHISGASFAYFVVWTEKVIVITKVEPDKTDLEKVLNNLAVFFRSFICPALLGLRGIAVCAKCE